jgi:hypothetical protein
LAPIRSAAVWGPRLLDWIVLVAHVLFVWLRGFTEWSLLYVGFWKILLGGCLLHGLYVIKVACAQFFDTLLSTGFFTSWVLSSVESVLWRVCRSLLSRFTPGYLFPTALVPWSDWSDTMSAPPDASGVATVVEHLALDDDKTVPGLAFATFFVIRVAMMFRG